MCLAYINQTILGVLFFFIRIVSILSITVKWLLCKKTSFSFIVQNLQHSFLFEGNFYNFISLCTNAQLACLYVMVIQRQSKLMGLQRNKNSSPQNNSKACFDMRDNTSSGDKAYLRISTKILKYLLMESAWDLSNAIV